MWHHICCAEKRKKQSSANKSFKSCQQKAHNSALPLLKTSDKVNAMEKVQEGVFYTGVCPRAEQKAVRGSHLAVADDKVSFTKHLEVTDLLLSLSIDLN